MNAVEPVARRTTRQRSAVVAELDRTDTFRSAQEIHSALASEGDKVGLSTVYRCLSALADAHDVDTLLRDDGETLYRRCTGNAHHPSRLTLVMTLAGVGFMYVVASFA